MSFNTFLSQLSTTNSTLDFFVDFNKISENVNSIEVKLHQLNYLIGKDDIKSAVSELFIENESCFSVLNIIIAVRENRRVLDSDGNVVDLNSYFKTPELVLEFIESTGLAGIFKNKQITNLVGYVFGIEVGLDTNARKNRGGKNMEKTIATQFAEKGISFRQEVKHTEFKELTSLGEDVKCFDFVIQTKNKIYLIETNYYNGGGSKLNEVARAYTDLALKINKYKKFEFV